MNLTGYYTLYKITNSYISFIKHQLKQNVFEFI